MFLIQGIFFQPTQSLGLGYDPSGVVAIVREHILPFMYGGFIYESRENPLDSLTGGIQDKWGRSRLSKIRIFEHRFTFTKEYVDCNGNQIFDYAFVKNISGIWVGNYTSREEPAFKGLSKCILTEVSDDFFSILPSEASALNLE